MDRIRDFERALIRWEGLLCVVLVLLMLVLAGYNVLYRNVLVPLQTHWAHSGPPVTVSTNGTPEDDKAAPSDTKVVSDQPKKKGSAGGFGGAFGGGGDSGGDAFDEPRGDDKADDEEARGFGGAFGEGAEEEEDEEDEGGFGGAFGKPQKPDESGAGDEQDEFFVEDEFANLPEITAEGIDESADGPEGGPPPEGSFAAWGVDFVDAIKLDWIDVFLRQLVIIVSFLGAAIATRRHKHINIDALSKVLRANGRRIVAILTNMLAIAVCLVLATAGSDLVRIGREYPRELVPFADQWMFQLMFPIGFGVLAFHFGVRLLEAAKGIAPADPAEIAAAGPSISRSGHGALEDEEVEKELDEAKAPAQEDSDDAEEPDEDSGDEETDVGNDSDTSPGDEPEAKAPPPDSQDESVDEDEEEIDR